MVQERAVEFALGELDRYYRAINQNYGDLIEHYKRQHQQHSDLLSNFERNVKNLKSTELYPALQTSTYKCLMDFTKEEKDLRESAKICTNSHKQFWNEVLQFEHAFREVKRKVGVCLSHKHKDEQKSIMQSLSKDVITVKKLAHDCLSSQLSLPLRPHDAVSALDSRYTVHGKDHLMQTCDHDISKLLEICKERKNEMNMFVHNFMKNIICGSDLIKYQKLQFSVFKMAMTDQDDVFKDLKLFHGIGPAYRACFAEVVRRKASKKLYKGLGESLAKKREIETQKRLEFLRAHDSCIPDDVLKSMGLSDLPSKCDVTFVERFDEKLLNIDKEDVDRYAPEYLAEFSSALSTDSSHPTKAKDIPSGSCTGYYSEPEDPPEGSELMEISGTSIMEDEIAKLKAKLSAIMALLCSLCPEVEYESLGDDKGDGILETAAKKKAEALQLTDECIKLTETMLRMKQVQ